MTGISYTPLDDHSGELNPCSNGRCSASDAAIATGITVKES